MGIGRRPRRKGFLAVIVALLCCEMLLAESHGLLGHVHSLRSGVLQSELSPLVDSHPIEFVAPGQDGDNSSCGICYCYRLLSQSFVPQPYGIIYFPFYVQPVLVHCISPAQSGGIKSGNRGPPQS
jgi:hypothetical protein